MQKSTLPYWLALMVLFLAAYGGWKWYQVERTLALRNSGGVVLSNLGPKLKQFELEERSGRMFRSEELDGRVWVATFFYASCPGTCTRLNANIKDLNTVQSLQGVTWVSITVDPETDTKGVLLDYAERHNADPERWLFCRGEMGYIQRLARDILGVDDVYYRGHKDYAIVVDRAGKIRGMFDATSDIQCQRMISLLESCLAEPVPHDADRTASPAKRRVAARKDAA